MGGRERGEGARGGGGGRDNIGREREGSEYSWNHLTPPGSMVCSCRAGQGSLLISYDIPPIDRARHHNVEPKHSLMRARTWSGRISIIGCQVRKNFSTLRSFCREDSTQSILSRNVSFSKKSRRVGRDEPIQVWRMALRAAAEMWKSNSLVC